jgi:hypothetical protein
MKPCHTRARGYPGKTRMDARLRGHDTSHDPRRCGLGVLPATAAIQNEPLWMPACAGMTSLSISASSPLRLISSSPQRLGGAPEGTALDARLRGHDMTHCPAWEPAGMPACAGMTSPNNGHSHRVNEVPGKTRMDARLRGAPEGTALDSRVRGHDTSLDSFRGGQKSCLY